MKTNLLKGSVTYGAVTILARVATIILIPILTRILVPDEYGALNIILTVTQLANFVITLEVAQAVTLFFTDHNRKDRERFPATALWFTIGMYFIFFIAVFFLGDEISKHIAEKNIGRRMLLDGAGLLAANGLFFFLQNQLRLEFKTLGYALLSLGYILLTSGGAIIGALYYAHPAEGVILGQAVGAGVIDLIGIALLWQRFKMGFHLNILRQMLRFSLPLVPAGFLLLGGQQLPKLILSVYGDLEDVGIYGLAAQIAGFAGLAVLGVQTAITPAVLVNHHKDETPGMLGKLFENFTIVSLMFCTFLSVFAKELILVFSTPAYARAANYVPFIAFSIALNSLYIFFPGKIIRGKSAAQLLASGGGFLAAVVSGLVLIKIDGVRGAAISTLFSAASFFCIWYLISQRLYRLPVNWFKIFKSILLSVVVCATGFFLIKAGFNLYSLALKCALLLGFTYLIAKEELPQLWNKYVKRTNFSNPNP